MLGYIRISWIGIVGSKTLLLKLFQMVKAIFKIFVELIVRLGLGNVVLLLNCAFKPLLHRQGQRVKQIFYTFATLGKLG